MQNTVIFGDITQRVIELTETRKLYVTHSITTQALNDFFSLTNNKTNNQTRHTIDRIINDLPSIESVIFNVDGFFGDDFLSNITLILNVIPTKTTVYFNLAHIENSEKESYVISLLKRKTYLFYNDTPNNLKIVGSDNNCQQRLPISIFGSCDSRDTLRIHEEISGPSDNLTLVSYIARNSIASTLSPPIDFSEEEFNIDSPFIKKCVKLDLNKKAIQETASSITSKEHILLIDFMDERFDLLSIGNSFATLSWDYRKTAHYQANKNNSCLAFDSSDKKEMTLSCLNKMIDECAKKIPKKNIYILNIPMATNYYDNNEEHLFDDKRYQITRYNNFLRELIIDLKNRNKGINIISPPKWMIYGDKSHLWGAHPYHYNKLLYLFSAQEIFQRRA